MFSLFVIFLLPLIFGLICAKKESKVTSLYSSYGVYGRIYAYITISLMLGAVMVVLGGLLTVVAFQDEYEGITAIAMMVFAVVIAVVLMVLGIRLYKGAKRICPSGLRKKLFRSMLITAFGCGMKIVLFFVPMIWEMVEPTEIIDGNGNKMMVLGRDVYDQNGNHVGTVTGRGNHSVTIRRK